MTYTSEGLQEHESESDSHPVTDTFLEQLHELSLLAQLVCTTFFDLGANFRQFMLDVSVRSIETTDLCQDPLGTLKIIATGLPTR